MLFKNKEVHEEQLEEMQNRTSNNSRGKRTFSGDALKNKLKNNEIPNQ